MDDILDLSIGLRTARRLISILSKSILPSFLQRPNTLWTGSPVTPEIYATHVRLITIDNPALSKLLAICKQNNVSFTSLFAYIVALAAYRQFRSPPYTEPGNEYKAAFDAMRFLKATIPMSFRHLAEPSPVSNTEMIDCVSAIDFDIPKFTNLLTDHKTVDGMRKLTKELKQGSSKSSDSEIALLNFVQNYEALFKGQVGKKRGATFELSNLGILDDNLIGSLSTAKEREESNKDPWGISGAYFSQSAEVTGAAFTINLVSCRGTLGCSLQWMEKVVENEFMIGFAGQIEGLIKELVEI